jgi:dUTP pyrophosphatase
LHLEIPAGYVGLVKDRSSTALAGLHTMAGVIDPSYRGELKILILNTTTTEYAVRTGQKIAQLVVVAYYDAPIEVVDRLEDLSSSVRAEGGFGSTGA